MSGITGLTDPVHINLFGYWNRRRRHRAMPRRVDIDPVDISKILPHVGLIDVLEDGARFRYRLVGTSMVDIFGQDFTGAYLDHAKQGLYREFLQDLYTDCVTARSPILSESVFAYRPPDDADYDKRNLWISRLLLPLAGDDDDVGMILFSNRFRPRSGLELETPYRAELIVEVREVERAVIDPPGMAASP